MNAETMNADEAKAAARRGRVDSLAERLFIQVNAARFTDAAAIAPRLAGDCFVVAEAFVAACEARK